MKSEWTVADEAIVRANNYANEWEIPTKELMQEEGVRLHAVMKNAYLEGFLHGFEHKFDQHNYEEK